MNGGSSGNSKSSSSCANAPLIASSQQQQQQQLSSSNNNSGGISSSSSSSSSASSNTAASANTSNTQSLGSTNTVTSPIVGQQLSSGGSGGVSRISATGGIVPSTGLPSGDVRQYPNIKMNGDASAGGPGQNRDKKIPKVRKFSININHF